MLSTASARRAFGNGEGLGQRLGSRGWSSRADVGPSGEHSRVRQSGDVAAEAQRPGGQSVPEGSGPTRTPDGALDTTVPPPMLRLRHRAFGSCVLTPASSAPIVASRGKPLTSTPKSVDGAADIDDQGVTESGEKRRATDRVRRAGPDGEHGESRSPDSTPMRVPSFWAKKVAAGIWRLSRIARNAEVTSVATL